MAVPCHRVLLVVFMGNVDSRGIHEGVILISVTISTIDRERYNLNKIYYYLVGILYFPNRLGEYNKDVES